MNNIVTVINELDLLKPLENKQSITLTYLHIENNVKIKGTEFAQDIEPSGKYLTYSNHQYKIEDPSFEYGTIIFNNPLVIEFISTIHGGWKTTLSNMFKGKKKKSLSKSIVKAGYDAIITIDSEHKELKEIVSLQDIK